MIWTVFQIRENSLEKIIDLLFSIKTNSEIIENHLKLFYIFVNFLLHLKLRQYVLIIAIK